jgi:peptidoglycan/LPS O-acetylase OafA/YrhL
MEAHTAYKVYIPEICSLRAIAVLLVVIYHAAESLTPGGFIGIDIFFVVSGFVISRSYLFDLR